MHVLNINIANAPSYVMDLQNALTFHSSLNMHETSEWLIVLQVCEIIVLSEHQLLDPLSIV